MTEISSNLAHEGKDGSDSSSSDEGSSSQRSEHSRSHNTFWSRARRLLRPSQGEKLREDLADALLTDTDIGNAFSPEEREMLNNILRFREITVEDIMVPRADIEAVDFTITIGEVLIRFEETGRSRLPVYNHNLDDPRGMVHVRDLLSYLALRARRDSAAAGENASPAFDLARVTLDETLEAAGLVRKILFVPPSMRAAQLLKTMQEERTQLALVIDEYGGTDGLVSHEDIVEMVVGDIEDEHDNEAVMMVRSGEDVFVCDARIELEEIAEAIGPDFDIRERLEDVDTLGGLIFSTLDRIPAKGETVQAVPGFDFEILEADRNRIRRVRISRQRAIGSDHAGDGDQALITDQRPVTLLPAP